MGDCHPLYSGRSALLVGDFLKAATNYAKSEIADPLEKRAADALVASLMKLADEMHGAITGLIDDEAAEHLADVLRGRIEAADARNVVAFPLRQALAASAFIGAEPDPGAAA